MNIISVSSSYLGSDNRLTNLAEVKFKYFNNSSLSCVISGLISSSVISPISLSALFTLASCSPCKSVRKVKLFEEEISVLIISFRSFISSFSSYLRSKSLRAFVLCSSSFFFLFNDESNTFIEAVISNKCRICLIASLSLLPFPRRIIGKGISLPLYLR